MLPSPKKIINICTCTIVVLQVNKRLPLIQFPDCPVIIS